MADEENEPQKEETTGLTAESTTEAPSEGSPSQAETPAAPAEASPAEAPASQTDASENPAEPPQPSDSPAAPPPSPASDVTSTDTSVQAKPVTPKAAAPAVPTPAVQAAPAVAATPAATAPAAVKPKGKTDTRILTPGSTSSSQSQSSQSAKARLDEDLKRWRGTALKIATQPPAKPINDEDYLLTRENFKINRNKEFASGHFAKYYNANKGNRELACKVTPLVNVPVPYKEHLIEAVRVMRYLSENMHPSIVAHTEFFVSKDKLYVFMEKLPGPNLEDVIKNQALYTKLSVPTRVSKWIRDVAEGVQFLYVCGIAHSNIRPSNIILYNENRSVKLSGFNQSMCLFDPYKEKEKFHPRIAEWNNFLAPECVASRFRPVLADVWAIGVVLVNLLSRYAPFKNKSVKFEEQWKAHLHKHHVPMQSYLVDLLAKCFVVDPLNRIDVAAMLLHPYLN